jgi:hypothetical protein
VSSVSLVVWCVASGLSWACKADDDKIAIFFLFFFILLGQVLAVSWLWYESRVKKPTWEDIKREEFAKLSFYRRYDWPAVKITNNTNSSKNSNSSRRRMVSDNVDVEAHLKALEKLE